MPKKTGFDPDASLAAIATDLKAFLALRPDSVEATEAIDATLKNMTGRWRDIRGDLEHWFHLKSGLAVDQATWFVGYVE